MRVFGSVGGSVILGEEETKVSGEVEEEIIVSGEESEVVVKGVKGGDDSVELR